METTRRQHLSGQLDKGTLECVVCQEHVKPIHSVWSCSKCNHVMHFHCVRKWASCCKQMDIKWRCPVCQNEYGEVPNDDYCLCGGEKNPEYIRDAAGAHTCRKYCQRPRECVHPCLDLCHPGPCSPCFASTTKQCKCGAETRVIVCSNKTPQLCSRQCSKTLACGVHKCTKNCHEGACGDCVETVTQVCYCQAALSRTVPCTAATGGKTSWTCGAPCIRVLACGRHICNNACHPPPCRPCDMLPENVTNCPCGKNRLAPGTRSHCTDPIPGCGFLCNKSLLCGPLESAHFCMAECHEGDCPPCNVTILQKCCCGRVTREVPCEQALDDFRCQRRCVKKKSCGRHRCLEVCCDIGWHRCERVCGSLLNCRNHRCEELCHAGRCADCPRVSFVELFCECGAEVLTPPIDCGTPRPPCSAPCSRARPCGHEPNHTCHPSACPPCVVLTTKPCYGAHQERKTIPCFDEFSCGMPCGKPLPCGKHTCIKSCHKGPCDKDKCRSVERPCIDNAMDLVSDSSLECDAVCREAYHQRMRQAQQILTSETVAPKYSDHVRAFATKDPAFAQQVHDELTRLVQRSYEPSTKKSVYHYFPAMNKQKRQFIHELCEHFGCESEDKSPNRSVVATTNRNKSRLPTMSITEVLARASKRSISASNLAAGGSAGSKSTNACAALRQHAAPASSTSLSSQKNENAAPASSTLSSQKNEDAAPASSTSQSSQKNDLRQDAAPASQASLQK